MSDPRKLHAALSDSEEVDFFGRTGKKEGENLIGPILVSPAFRRKKGGRGRPSGLCVTKGRKESAVRRSLVVYPWMDVLSSIGLIVIAALGARLWFQAGGRKVRRRGIM